MEAPMAAQALRLAQGSDQPSPDPATDFFASMFFPTGDIDPKAINSMVEAGVQAGKLGYMFGELMFAGALSAMHPMAVAVARYNVDLAQRIMTGEVFAAAVARR